MCGHRQRMTTSSQTAQKTIFSGIQPTGVPHLGNYLGALKQWRQLQDEITSSTSSSGGTPTKLLYCVVDLHAITSPREGVNRNEIGSQLRQRKREMLAALIAIGLDPRQSTLFYQSSVPAHSELMWILSCTASVGYLSRMTQWKSKLSLDTNVSPLDEKSKAALKLGLFSYPVLQAADVLVHRATHVPVGDDQRQHLEFARECATNFNHTYGRYLTAPETILSPARRVMNLQDPRTKMSKSDADPASRILITDTEAQIKKKIMSALTDSIEGVSYEPETRPGVSNLVDLLAILKGEGKRAEEVAKDLAAEGTSLKSLKQMTAETVVSELSGIKEKYEEALNKEAGAWLNRVAEEGGEAARINAEVTMRDVRSAVGLG